MIDDQTPLITIKFIHKKKRKNEQPNKLDRLIQLIGLCTAISRLQLRVRVVQQQQCGCVDVFSSRTGTSRWHWHLRQSNSSLDSGQSTLPSQRLSMAMHGPFSHENSPWRHLLQSCAFNVSVVHVHVGSSFGRRQDLIQQTRSRLALDWQQLRPAFDFQGNSSALATFKPILRII